MKVAVVDIKGKETGREANLSDAVFGIEPNDHAVYLDVKQYLANQRQGTHKAKERAEITGSTRKIKKQKGTEIGNAMPLRQIPLGTIISCIELRPGQGAVMARSAGAFAQLMAREGKYATVKLPSGETRMILADCMATIGAVSNSDHQLLVSGKAGRSRWLGRRPRTRPVVMNPVDHPMGGGEGRSSGGHPRSRKGLPAKGFRTRSKTKSSNKYIVERRKK